MGETTKKMCTSEQARVIARADEMMKAVPKLRPGETMREMVERLSRDGEVIGHAAPVARDGAA